MTELLFHVFFIQVQEKNMELKEETAPSYLKRTEPIKYRKVHRKD